MKKITAAFFAVSLTFLTACTMANAGSFSEAQKTEIEEVVREYLGKHPEVLREMAQKLEENDRAAEDSSRVEALKQNAAQVFKRQSDPFTGNAKGDVIIVEFMDYNCGWCKRSMAEVNKLVEADPKLKVIFKEFPIFGENSEFAARAALAAAKQGKYWDLHVALFGHEGQITKEVATDLAKGLGLDMAKLEKDMVSNEVSQTLADNHALGKTLSLSGTPAFIIDGTVVPGYLPIEGLQAAVADVRGSGGCKLC